MSMVTEDPQFSVTAYQPVPSTSSAPTPQPNVQIGRSEALLESIQQMLVVFRKEQQEIKQDLKETKKELILDHIANNSDDYGDSQPVPRVSKIASIKAHQSGINSIAITSKSGGFHPDHFLIASGGDDNKIALWKITGHLSNDKIFSISTSHVCDVYGHASQVTGLSWLTPYHLISTSIDQRVTIWKIHKVDDRDNTQFSSYRNQDEIKSKSNHNPFTDHSGNEKLEVLSTNFTGVPDVKGLTVSNITKHITQTKENPRESSLSKRVFLYGVGLQVYDIEINE
ncbi:uncharacterized protein [Palaemon carinicauda]|uniref:uncharacterized protein n=1 Tax=Palaemon carinicauda TaxID=392227 RepID=UPI0035B62B82